MRGENDLNSIIVIILSGFIYAYENINRCWLDAITFIVCVSRGSPDKG